MAASASCLRGRAGRRRAGILQADRPVLQPRGAVRAGTAGLGITTAAPRTIVRCRGRRRECAVQSDRGWPRGCRPANRRRGHHRVKGSSWFPPDLPRCEIEFAVMLDETSASAAAVLASDLDLEIGKQSSGHERRYRRGIRVRECSRRFAPRRRTGFGPGMASRAPITARAPAEIVMPRVAVAENRSRSQFRPRLDQQRHRGLDSCMSLTRSHAHAS